MLLRSRKTASAVSFFSDPWKVWVFVLSPKIRLLSLLVSCHLLKVTSVSSNLQITNFAIDVPLLRLNAMNVCHSWLHLFLFWYQGAQLAMNAMLSIFFLCELGVAIWSIVISNVICGAGGCGGDCGGCQCYACDECYNTAAPVSNTDSMWFSL